MGLHCHSGACCHWLAPQNHRGSALVCQLQPAVIADRHRRRRAGSSSHDLLLLPITLTDPRKWHWSTRPIEGKRTLGKITAFISYFVIRIQVAVLYFHSTVAKLSQQEWVDGTAVYYFAQEKTIGFNGFFQALTKPIVTSPFVVIPTWGTLLVQIVIFAALFAPKKHWRLILIIAVFMHEIFAVMLGLISFSIIMAGILILYLTPIDSTIQFTYIRRLLWNKKHKKGEVSV